MQDNCTTGLPSHVVREPGRFAGGKLAACFTNGASWRLAGKRWLRRHGLRQGNDSRRLWKLPMSAPDAEPNDVDAQLQAIHERCGELLNKCHYRSAYQAYVELGRLARREGLAIPYIVSVFHQMDLAKDQLQPQTQRERAIELLGLVENEEAARRIQPNLPEWLYEYEAGWRTACGYENLAEAAGTIDGFNSEGMHAIIAEGLQVCRRTGKLQCIRCFREYATDVYAAADDLGMALHQCQAILDHPGPWADRGNRHWLAARKAAWLHLLNGNAEQAEAMLRRALELSKEDGVGLVVEAEQRVGVDLAQVLVLTGRDDLPADWPQVAAPAPPGPVDPAGETLRTLGARRLMEGEVLAFDYRWDLVRALRAGMRGDWDEAIERLSRWDRRLTESHVLHEWFETRLRLVAAHRLAGRRERIERLAAPLREKAAKASDWLTLRRLERLLDENEPATPLALLGPLATGPFAAAPHPTGAAQTIEPAAKPAAAAPDDAPQQAPETTPLEADLRNLLDRWMQVEDHHAAAHQELLEELLAYTPQRVSHPRDAARLLYLAAAPVNAESGRAAEIWTWAQALAAPFPDAPTVLSRLAALGELLREQNEALEAIIPFEELERLFRKSLRLDANHADNFTLAGLFFFRRGDLGEAERCFARGFRLDRSNSFLALRLAEVYRQTERPRDALAALDMCLREGHDDPALAWEAARTALSLEHFDAALTYLDQFETLQPGEPNTQYCRALALVELGRAEEALSALDEEERRAPDQTLHLDVMRACACFDQERAGDARRHVQKVLAYRLREADFLSLAGLVQLAARLWRRVNGLPAEDPLRQALEERLLAAGLMPDEYFEAQRQAADEAEGEVRFYRCLVRQPLDADWASSPGCLPRQESWTEYFAEWGVLAANEEDAARRALTWQARCYPQPAEIAEIQTSADEFLDKPGVVWQGLRHGPEAAES